jgi:predicted TIM-barrel fold metal-dependent hydrolase
MDLFQYHPIPKLITPTTPVLTPRFEVFDTHNHLSEDFGNWVKRPIADLLSLLDEARVKTYVDLDGGWGEKILQTHLDSFKSLAPDRFKIFGGVDWSAWPEQGNRFGDWAARRLRVQVGWGAEGLKVWKPLGLNVLDDRKQLVKVDDPRLDPLWETAAELNIPVLIHVADPVAFFDPLDAHNERWEELIAHPDWHFPSPPYPSFLSILEGLSNLVVGHPRTKFIGAHVGCYAENLYWVGNLLDRCPNYYIDISARIAELGRQPYSTKRFFLNYADRILYGLDSGPDVLSYQISYRFLESEDEYFNYASSEIPGQGRWSIYGLHLPDDVLEKVYFSNASNLFSR